MRLLLAKRSLCACVRVYGGQGWWLRSTLSGRASVLWPWRSAHCAAQPASIMHTRRAHLVLYCHVCVRERHPLGALKLSVVYWTLTRSFRYLDISSADRLCTASLSKTATLCRSVHAKNDLRQKKIENLIPEQT